MAFFIGLAIKLGMGSSSSIVPPPTDDFLIQQNGDFVLQQNGDRIILRT